MQNELQKDGGVTAYFTDRVDKVDNKMIFPLNHITNDYFIIIPETRVCDDQFFNRLSALGIQNGVDCLVLKHSLLLAGDGYNDIYCNSVRMESNVNVYISGYNNKIKIGKNVKFPAGFSIKIGSESSLMIGDNVIFQPRSLMLSEGIDFVVDDRSVIQGLDIFINSFSSVLMGKGCSFQRGKLRTGRNQKIILGDDIMASWEIVFLPHDGHLIWDLNTERAKNNTVGEQRLSIEIGDHCWLGGECVIAGNTRLGSGSIVGYRSFVNGKFPNNCIIAGSPARLIKKDIAWSRENLSVDEQGDFLKIPVSYRKKTERE